MDAEVDKAADQSTTTDDDQQSWRSWFGKRNAHIAADGADDEDVGELDDDLDADEPDDDLDAAGFVTADEADEFEPVRPRLLRRPLFGGEKQVSFPLALRPLIHPKLRQDPRWRVWITERSSAWSSSSRSACG